MNDRVTIDIASGVAHVRMTRADKMNALDDPMFTALREAGEKMRAAKGVRAIVLSGDGRSFCAGLDTSNFGAMASGDRSRAAALIARPRGANGANDAQQIAMIWREVPVPVIAAVHGAALGGGFQLCMGADMRFVAPDAKLALLEMKWGLVPDVAGIALLRHLVREDLARDLVYTGRIFSGEEAFRIGLATRVCADPRAEALAYAAELAGKNPHAIQAAKRLMNLAYSNAERTEVFKAETAEQAALIGSPNQAEAAAANLQKRAPNFTDV